MRSCLYCRTDCTIEHYGLGSLPLILNSLLIWVDDSDPGQIAGAYSKREASLIPEARARLDPRGPF